ncbi:MAG: 2-oxoacid:ferredoxin oxidoreductase subunit beta [Anaerolineae bacterium]|nr:2-oxoacid:ferredoxin oxidoreductase subunit beta [Anaerolineae bacterium]
MVTLEDYASPVQPAWCPGCGNFGILNAIKGALVELDLSPHQVVIYTGIGQASKLPDYMNVTAFTSLHGRPIPIAQGAHLANHRLKAIVHSGDGDTYGIGGNHFMHIMRRNPDVTIIAHNNLIYGLTKGQYSPTSPQGFASKTSPPPEGALEKPVNPLTWALSAGATFVARSFAGDGRHLTAMMVAAIQHKGVSLLDVLQPCVVFNPNYSFDFYRGRVYKLEAEEAYAPTDRQAAWQKAQEWGERIPIGVFYREEGRPSYEEQVPALQAGPLAERELRRWSEADYQALEAEFV